MKRDELGDLMGFLAVHEERSFTRAAARLGTSQSALSHGVKRLEARLGLRLLTRTTRNMSPTEAGDRLAETLRPSLESIRAGIESLGAYRDRPSGRIRLTSSHHAARLIFPKLLELMAEHPDIHVEISVEQRLVDIVEERFDAGIRLGESIEKDMIAQRIGPDMRMLAAAAPAYLTRHGTPQTPQELMRHRCINLRLPTLGGLYPWEFGHEGRPVNLRVEGPLISNDVDLIIEAALAGLGICCLPDLHLQPLIDRGQLVPLLRDWSPSFAGYHLYYPARMQGAAAFSLLLDKLRWRG